MDKRVLQELLDGVAQGSITTHDAFAKLSDLPFADLEFAKIDHHRSLRKGFPEVIFCEGKTLDQIEKIVRKQRQAGESVLGTRTSVAVLETIANLFPDMGINLAGRCFTWKSPSWQPDSRQRGSIVVISGGTADLPVVEECKTTINMMGHETTVIMDVGVAGIHRLLAHREQMYRATVIIVVAGMEGALLSVVGGLVDCPVIGVPTSVGYGSHFRGMVPMLAMLNSCASGATVVNIDNGFGAGYAAVLINSDRRVLSS